MKEEIRSQAYTIQSQAEQIQYLLVGKEELQAEVVTLKEELDELKDSIQQHAVILQDLRLHVSNIFETFQDVFPSLWMYLV